MYSRRRDTLPDLGLELGRTWLKTVLQAPLSFMNLTYYSCDYCGNRVNVTASTSSRRVPLVRRQVSSGSRSDCKRKRPPSRNTSQRAFARQMALDRTPRVDGVSLEPLHQNFGVLVSAGPSLRPYTSSRRLAMHILSICNLGYTVTVLLVTDLLGCRWKVLI